MEQIGTIQWQALTPELIILAAAALLSILDLVWKENVSRKWLAGLGILAAILAGTAAIRQMGEQPIQFLQDTFRVDALSLTMKVILLAGTVLVLLFSLIERENRKAEGEYYYLLLAALLGGMMMVSSADLITLYVGLELLALSSYILVGLPKHRLASSEAAWKYVVLGGVSSAFILYGMSFLYGLTGSTNLFAINQKMIELLGGPYENLLLLSLFLMTVGFGFKIAAAPFHMWTPDVYQGSATPVTAFLAVVSKAAAFGMVFRTLVVAYFPFFQTGLWFEIVAWLFMLIAAVSMVIGNTVALMQTDAKRFIAYSSIAHAGYLLVPFAVFGYVGFNALSSFFYYVVAYLLMTTGALAIIEWVTRNAGTGDIRAFAGLYHRSPGLAIAMTIFLISLAGFPVTAGFFGKFAILMEAIKSTQIWLAAVMIVTTVISYYYYFRVIRQMYFRTEDEKPRLSVSWPITLLVFIGLAGTLLLGILPDLLMGPMNHLDFQSGFMMIESAPK